MLETTNGVDSYSGGAEFAHTPFWSPPDPWREQPEHSNFAIYVDTPCTFSQILPPVNDVSSATDDGMSAYKYGSRGVIPVQFKAACDGNPIDTKAEADAHSMKLKLTRLASNAKPEAVVEDVSTGSANSGDLFRFDDAADHYIYNIGAKNLARGTYKLTISEAHADGSHDEWFSIK